MTTAARNVVALYFLLAGCAGHTRESLRSIPDLAPDSAASEVRGTAAAARSVPATEQIEIIGQLVRQFFRPTRSQARWIDPQPLAHRRATEADSAAVLDEDWGAAIVQSTGFRRVCVLEDDAGCRGRPGAVLRFSAPYALGKDSVVIFTRITRVEAGASAAPGKGFEMEFHLVRSDREWRIVSKRTIAGSGA